MTLILNSLRHKVKGFASNALRALDGALLPPPTSNCYKTSGYIYILLLGVLLLPAAAIAQSTDESDVRFEINSSTIRTTAALDHFLSETDSLRSNGELESITITGSASPDGPAAANERLALARAEALRSVLLSRTGVSASQITVNTAGNNWDGFLCRAGEILTPAQMARVEAAVSATTSHRRRVSALRGLDGGRIWRILRAEVFPYQRFARATVAPRNGSIIESDTLSNTVTHPPVTLAEPAPAQEPAQEPAPVPHCEPATGPAADAPLTEPEADWTRRAYLKTNMPAWLLLLTNVAGEIDCAPHWSAALSVYYSGFNYFTGHLKFRTLTFMPEVRWWPHAANHGFFVGAHAGIAFYNCAFNGTYRYQDHDAATPALGGGINAGWRFNLRNPRWKIELSLGAGIYKLDYDVFLNYHDGVLTDRRQRTFYGIDNAAVSVCYSFSLPRRNKEGGER